MFIEMLSEASYTRFEFAVFKNGKDTKRPGDIIEYLDDNYLDVFDSADEFAREMADHFDSHGDSDDQVTSFLEHVLRNDKIKVTPVYKDRPNGRPQLYNGDAIAYKVEWKGKKDFFYILFK